MAIINYELNKINILQEKYFYKSYLTGYAIFTKSENGSDKIKNTIYYLESHGRKYQINIEKIYKDKKVVEVNIVAEEMDIYDIPTCNEKIKKEFYYFEGGKLEEDFSICKIKDIDELKRYRIFNEDVSTNESRCIISEHLFIPLQDTKLDKFDMILYEGTKLEEEYEFAKKIMNLEDLKAYVKSKR